MIRQPVERMAQAAAAMLIERIDPPDLPPKGSKRRRQADPWFNCDACRNMPQPPDFP